MSVQTEEELHDWLDAEFAWRRKEISDLRGYLGVAEADAKRVFLRALYVIIYAHWEGFVKEAAKVYLRYIGCRRLKLVDLPSHFVAIGIGEVWREAAHPGAIRARSAIIDVLREGSDRRAKITDDCIDTSAGSNLGAEQLKHTLEIVGGSYSNFELRANFLDESLRRIRNGIAHGERIVPTLEEVDEARVIVLDLMDRFRTEISNAVSMRTYTK
jgi:hypothetical protein